MTAVAVVWDYDPDGDHSYLEQPEFSGTTAEDIVCTWFYAVDEEGETLDSLGCIDFLASEQAPYIGTIYGPVHARKLAAAGELERYQTDLMADVWPELRKDVAFDEAGP